MNKIHNLFIFYITLCMTSLGFDSNKKMAECSRKTQGTQGENYDFDDSTVNEESALEEQVETGTLTAAQNNQPLAIQPMVNPPETSSLADEVLNIRVDAGGNISPIEEEKKEGSFEEPAEALRKKAEGEAEYFQQNFEELAEALRKKAEGEAEYFQQNFEKFRKDVNPRSGFFDLNQSTLLPRGHMSMCKNQEQLNHTFNLLVDTMQGVTSRAVGGVQENNEAIIRAMNALAVEMGQHADRIEVASVHIDQVVQQINQNPQLPWWIWALVGFAFVGIGLGGYYAWSQHALLLKTLNDMKQAVAFLEGPAKILLGAGFKSLLDNLDNPKGSNNWRWVQLIRNFLGPRFDGFRNFLRNIWKNLFK